MAKKIHFELVTPERKVFEDEVDQVSLPTPQGEITILPHHIPLISVLIPGEVRIKKDQEEYFLAVAEGFIEITGKKVRVLTDSAERAEEIDIAQVEEAKKRAQELLKEKRTDAKEFAALSARLERELARLKVARRRKWRKEKPSSP